MKRWISPISVLALAIMATTAHGHFVYIVPDDGALTARVFLSETLSPDPQIDADFVKDVHLAGCDDAGKDAALSPAKGEDALVFKIPAGTRVIHGTDDLGVTSREADHPYVLVYHPKTILGDPFRAPVVGAGAWMELLPVGKVGAVKLQLLVQGNPLPKSEITVLLPGGESKKVTTDDKGLTEAFAAEGRYGAWARDWENTPGQRDGNKYDEVRHYATLVFDAGHAAMRPDATQPTLTASPFATLPEATTSFGAVASDGWLYIYGGHVAPTHSYSTAAVSGRFSRLNLADGKTWETLPGGPAMQGLNLAAYAGKIYRIGGMAPHNKPGEPEDISSTAQCAAYDPATHAWEALPDLPAGRSSHDVVVAGHTLYVVGGWTLNGADPTDWRDTMLAMDLNARPLAWKEIPQPFKRRALIAATLNGNIYVIGGFDEDSNIHHDVAIFDPKAGTWTKGPDLPGGEQNGFGPAACTLDGTLYVSVADGTLYRLSAKGDAWQPAGTSTPRFVHRLAPDGNNILVIGGAADGHNFDLIEQVVPSTTQASPMN